MKKHKALNLILTILGLLVWVFSVVLVSQLIVAYIMVALVGRTQIDTPLWTSIYSAVVYILALFVIVFVPLAIQNRQIKRKGKKKKKSEEEEKALSPSEIRNDLGIDGLPTWTDIGLGPIGFIVSFILAALLVGLFTVFPWFNAEEVQDVGYTFMAPGFDRLLAFFILCVVAPIAEEIIFRGWLYTKLRDHLNKRVSDFWGIVISSLLVSILFGLIHFQWNVGVNVFALSIVLCALREITGTVYAGILTHMIKNGVAFYIVYVLGVL